MLIGSIICFTIGLLSIVLGVIIWKKQKLSLIHEYHWKKVKKEDIPKYAQQVGIGMIVLGSGILITGIALLFTDAVIAWAPLAIGLLVGIIMLVGSEKI